MSSSAQAIKQGVPSGAPCGAVSLKMTRATENLNTAHLWECWPTARQRDQVVRFVSVASASSAAPVGRL